MGRFGCWLGPFWSCFFFHWGRFGRGRFGLRGPFSTFIGAVLAMGRFGRFPYRRRNNDVIKIPFPAWFSVKKTRNLIVA